MPATSRGSLLAPQRRARPGRCEMTARSFASELKQRQQQTTRAALLDLYTKMDIVRSCRSRSSALESLPDPQPTKPIAFEASSLDVIRTFPPAAKEECGFQLYRVQIGEQPNDFKPMPQVGPGVEEIRIRDADGIYWVIYTARFDEAVYVLHAFVKKTQQTASKDVELARIRFRNVLARRRNAAGAAKKEQ